MVVTEIVIMEEIETVEVDEIVIIAAQDLLVIAGDTIDMKTDGVAIEIVRGTETETEITLLVEAEVVAETGD